MFQSAAVAQQDLKAEIEELRMEIMRLQDELESIRPREKPTEEKEFERILNSLENTQKDGALADIEFQWLEKQIEQIKEEKSEIEPLLKNPSSGIATSAKILLSYKWRFHYLDRMRFIYEKEVERRNK